MKNQTPGNIYFAIAEEVRLIKIGFTTKHVDERTKSLNGASPIPIKIIASAPGTILDEWALHTKFFHLHARFEWFSASDELLSFIEEVRALNQIPAHYRSHGKQSNPLNGPKLQARRKAQARAA